MEQKGFSFFDAKVTPQRPHGPRVGTGFRILSAAKVNRQKAEQNGVEDARFCFHACL